MVSWLCPAGRFVQKLTGSGLTSREWVDYARSMTIQMRSCSAQYNAFTSKYEMAPSGATAQYNAFTGEYELAKPGATPKYNPHIGQYELAGPGESIHYHYNPMTGQSGFNYCA